MIKYDLTCQSTKPNFCNRVKTGLEITKKTITDLLKFKEPIVIQITFKSLESKLLGDDDNDNKNNNNNKQINKFIYLLIKEVFSIIY